MAATTGFELVSPERLLMQQQVEMVVVPGAEGNLGVLPRHAPLISTLRPGVIDVFEKRNADPTRIFVAGGFVEVTPERCTVLAEEAIPVQELDTAALDQQIRDLTEDVADAKTEPERQAAERALTLARAKRSVAGAA